MNMLIKNCCLHNSEATCIYIEDGIISAIGGTELLENVSSNTEVIDAKSQLVLPGFNDSHLHLVDMGRFLTSVNCYGLTSIAQIIDKGREFIAQNDLSIDSLVYGMGWNQDYFTDEVRNLTRFDLDQISTENPIIFRRACGHLTSCNTKALELLGIDDNTSQVDGGVFEVDSLGFPTGVFSENAMQLLLPLMPTDSVESLKRMLKPAISYALANGLTSVQTNDYNDMDGKNDDVITAYKELEAENELNLRVNLQCCFGNVDNFESFIESGYYTGLGSNKFKIGALKMFIDGSLGARTALMRNPYNDDPLTIGVQCMESETLTKMVEVANANNFQVMVHAIGDRAIELVLDSYEKVLGESTNKLRHGINHCQITDYELLKRFSTKDILAFVQPIFIHYDLHIAEERVGKKLASTSYAFKTMEDLGLHTSYGTDAPIEDLNPFECIHCAVTRQDLNSFPKDRFYSNECVDIATAINNYTRAGAYASFEEDIKGSIEVGMLADLIVLDRNLYQVDESEIKDCKVIYTIVNGEVVYESVQ